MTLQSSNLLPALRELPGGKSDEYKSFRDHITSMVNMDKAMHGAEFASAVSTGLWFIFSDRSVAGINIPGTGINVDDRLFEAYEAQYPRLAADHSLHEHWQEMVDRGPDSMEGFINGLKGKVAELDAKEQLQQRGYTNVEIHSDSNHPISDISAINPDGEPVIISVKTGTSYTAGDIEGWMAEDPDVLFALGSELHQKAADAGIDTADSVIADIGQDYARVEGTTDGLNTLSDNMGINVPDGVVDIIPYAAAIMAGARLVYRVIKTEKEFKAADRTTKNKIQVVQSLTVMSRFGVTSVLAAAGGAGGTAVGSIIPGPGNLIGGVVGSFAGAGMGMYLNRHLQPHMLNLALNITGLTNDDLFYYKNKTRIDAVALNFRKIAGELVAEPAY